MVYSYKMYQFHNVSYSINNYVNISTYALYQCTNTQNTNETARYRVSNNNFSEILVFKSGTL